MQYIVAGWQSVRVRTAKTAAYIGRHEETRPTIRASFLSTQAGDPEGDSPRMQYIPTGWYPVKTPRHVLALPRIGKSPKLSPEECAEVVRDRGHCSLRQLAERYGVSYETIRRAITAQDKAVGAHEDYA